MKILITTVFFPPQNAIASQRPYSWAREWSKLGHEVTVLTISKNLSKTDLSPQPLEGVRMIEVSGGPILERLRERRNAPNPVEIHSGVPKNSVFKSWLRHRGLLSSIRWPDVFDLWVPHAVQAIPPEPFDLIVSTFGPPASLAVGYRAKQLSPRAKWICDFRDLWTDNHVYPGFWPFTLFERFAERKYLRRANGVTTVSEPLANSLRAKVSLTPVAVFENGFQPSELRTLSAESAFESRDKIRLVYTGSLHRDQRNPKPLLEALARIQEDLRRKIEVVFVGPPESFLSELIKQLNLQSTVRVVSSVAREHSLRFQRDADVLLFFETRHEAARDGVLTGKLFEYLAAGKPIWAIGIDPNSTVGNLIETNEAGTAFGSDVARLAYALQEMLSPNYRHVRANQNEKFLQRFDRSAIAAKFIGWIENSVRN